MALENGLGGGEADQFGPVLKQLWQKDCKGLGTNPADGQCRKDIYAFCLGRVHPCSQILCKNVENLGLAYGIAKHSKLFGSGEANLDDGVIKHGNDGILSMGGGQGAHCPDAHNPVVGVNANQHRP